MKTHYDIECPYCQAELGCRPSILHRMGLDVGYGDCPQCKQTFEIHHDKSSDSMATKAAKEAEA